MVQSLGFFFHIDLFYFVCMHMVETTLSPCESRDLWKLVLSSTAWNPGLELESFGLTSTLTSWASSPVHVVSFLLVISRSGWPFLFNEVQVQIKTPCSTLWECGAQWAREWSSVGTTDPLISTLKLWKHSRVPFHSCKSLEKQPLPSDKELWAELCYGTSSGQICRLRPQDHPHLQEHL